MKQQIDEVCNYFKSKLVSGDFDVKDSQQHTVEVEVDGEYRFHIWTANLDYGIATYASQQKKSFMHLAFSSSDKIAIWEHIEAHQAKARHEALREEYERLREIFED